MADSDDIEVDDKGKVPVERLRKVIAERNDARTQLAARDGEIATWKADYDALKADAAAQATTLQSRHAEDIGLVEGGIRDPLGRTAVREAWAAQPRDGRGKSPSEWWQGLIAARDAHLAAPETAAAPSIPRTLVGYLPEPPAKDDSKTAPRAKHPPNAGKPAPKANGSTLADLPAGADITEMLGALRHPRA